MRVKSNHIRMSLTKSIARTLPAVLGYGAALSVILGVLDYTGGDLRGYNREAGLDEFDRKEELRRNKRRPIEETIEQLGEGRGE